MKNKWVLGLFTCCLAGALYVFFNYFESYEETEDKGWNINARSNPYLAAEHYLSRQGTTPKTVNSFKQIQFSEDFHTLFIDDSMNVVSSRQVSQITQWLEQGGHLIVVAHPAKKGSERDPLLQTFGFESVDIDCNCDQEEKATKTLAKDKTLNPKKLSETMREMNAKFENGETVEQDKLNDEATMASVKTPEISSLNFQGIDASIQVHFDPLRGLYHPIFDLEEGEQYEEIQPFYWDGNEYGIQFIQMSIGNGMMTVIADSDIWKSDNIQLFSHAYLLSILAANSNNIQLFVDSSMPSVFVLAWQNASEVISAFCLWLICWLVYRGRRFGPIKKQTITVRRSIGAHIQAAANFLWRQKESKILLQTLQEGIHLRAKLVLRNYAAMNIEEQHLLLASHSNVTPSEVTTAMNSKTITNEDDFTDSVRVLQKIRKTL